MSLKDKQKSFSERISGLEKSMTQVLYAINQRFTDVDKAIGTLREYTEALMELQGAEDVTKHVNDTRTARAQARAEQDKAALAEGVTEGYVMAADVVGERSIITGHYSDKDGNVQTPGWVQYAVPSVDEKFRSQLLGQPVGTKLSLPNGFTFELEQIYGVDEAKAQQILAAKQQAAATAATQTASADETADTTTATPDLSTVAADATTNSASSTQVG